MIFYDSSYFFLPVFLIWYTVSLYCCPDPLGLHQVEEMEPDLGTLAFLKPMVKVTFFLMFLMLNLSQFLAELALPLAAVPHGWRRRTMGTVFHVPQSKEKINVASWRSSLTLTSLSAKASVKLTLLSPSGPVWVGCPGGPGSPGWPGIPGSPSIPWGPRGP